LWLGYNVRLFRRDNVELSTEIHSYIEPTEEALVARLSAREEYAILHDAYKGVWTSCAPSIDTLVSRPTSRTSPSHN